MTATCSTREWSSLSDSSLEAPIREERLSLFSHQSETFELSHWRRVFLKIVDGTIEWKGVEGMGVRNETLTTGDVVELFTFGVHTLRAVAGEAQIQLTLIDPRALGDKPSFRMEKISLAPLSEEGVDPQTLEEEFHRISRHSLRTDLPSFMNQLFSGRTRESERAHQLAYDLRTTLATQEAAPAFAAIEREVIAALAKLCEWPESASGVAVPGGTFGNFMALHLARFSRFPQVSDFGHDGTGLGVFVSRESHYSIEKAVLALGIGRKNLIPIATDAAGAMDTSALEKAIQSFRDSGGTPLSVIGTAGTTVHGAFDPLRAIAGISARFGLWFHVDGAWGGPALFSTQARELLLGVEYADSFSLDAHKLLGAPLTSTIFLTRHPRLLAEANQVSGGSYLFHASADISPLSDPGLFTWQCGRGPDALQFWALWRSLGRIGLGDFVDRLFALRDLLVRKIESESRLRLVARPQFLNVCLQVSPPAGRTQHPASDWTRHVRDKLKDSGRAMINYSSDQNGAFLRMILAHPNLTWEILDRMIQDILDVT